MRLLASLITVQTLQGALQVVGYPAIFLFIFIECIGVPLPGETMLLLASFYTATTGRLSLPLVIVCAALAAILGDNVGYMIGRSGGRALVEKYGRFIFVKPEHLDRAEHFFERHGAKTVFFGRFVSLLRIWAAFLAGMNRMHWRVFLFYNGLGGIIWATYVGVLGYIAGHYFHDHFDLVERAVKTIGWLGLAVFVLSIVLTVVFVKLRLARRARQAEHA